MLLREQIQNGNALTIEVLKVIAEGLDKLKNQGVAIATFDSEFRVQYDKIMMKRNGKIDRDIH